MTKKGFPKLFKDRYDYLLREVLESVDDAVLVFGQSREIIYANPAAASVFGSNVEQLTSMSIKELIPVDNYEHFSHIISQLTASGSHAVQLQGKTGFVGQRAGGYIFYAEGKLAKLQKEPAYILVLRDITMRKAVEEELKTALAHLKVVGSKVEYRFEHPKLLNEFPSD